MMGFSAVELLTAYGYSLSVFIPISFLWTIPVDWIRWILVVVGAVVSGSVVAGPIWKGLKEGFWIQIFHINAWLLVLKYIFDIVNITQ